MPDTLTPVRKTILLMDDDSDILELFELNLDKLGYKTLASSNGDEAINLYKQSIENNTPIHAVIIDLAIPSGLNGRDTATEIRKLDPKAKLIVSSGDSSCPEMTNHQEYGFDAAYEKNFNREKMKSVLEQVFEADEIT